ncbi:MAG: UDP-N-acetylmuramate--L-alanine ligase [Candidatus Buchananbacteria bacterium CG10_big_fil_rev_8_21_14_0_10_42_9]|uniref:UDP-N-acetylmuramate--L-alanine ligase n=1 Tax=Candidatus Buchananbacteria bacterium CG10_big_fil_rev_8_21_14_0_10_42_9 TaxID=1974526 RepID=A0A2H0W2L7_9BACT|nr:MAG: UDP-N-acetylmuramate--L-alanine ligase [Candidatus Buchananbacteria bacterium CG10_big_fil_rev_8_21_14_0_10_42_9]
MIDFKKVRRVYFIGIKGVAMAGLAIILKQRKFIVSGSDTGDVFVTDKLLKKNNIKFNKKFDPINIDTFNPDLVVVGTSFSQKNLETLYAQKKKIPILLDSELRGILSKSKKTIAVSGMHGKTTITAWLSYIFNKSQRQPSYLIGAAGVIGLTTPAAWDTGDYFIVEADEYVKSQKEKVAKFLDLQSDITIISGIEWEHVDVYKDIGAVKKMFAQLINQTKKNKGKIVACLDSPAVRSLVKGRQDIESYGYSRDARWKAYDLDYNGHVTSFDVLLSGKKIGRYEISLMGEHNVLNALACIVVCKLCRIPEVKIKRLLRQFKGVERRFQVQYKKKIIFVDDYGHHPTEIRATLRAIQQKYYDRFIWCVFQSHTISRTKALLPKFAKAFFYSDKVLVTDIFESAREKNLKFKAPSLARAILRTGQKVEYTGNLEQTTQYLRANVKAGDVVVTMGAGDIYKLIKMF